jgi:hypothetical protein
MSALLDGPDRVPKPASLLSACASATARLRFVPIFVCFVCFVVSSMASSRPRLQSVNASLDTPGHTTCPHFSKTTNAPDG